MTQISNMTHTYIWHDSFVWHDSYIYLTWLRYLTWLIYLTQGICFTRLYTAQECTNRTCNATNSLSTYRYVKPACFCWSKPLKIQQTRSSLRFKCDFSIFGRCLTFLVWHDSHVWHVSLLANTMTHICDIAWLVYLIWHDSYLWYVGHAWHGITHMCDLSRSWPTW